jgi:hypothetical protein
LAQGEQRNKWQGPAAGGKDAVYTGCELEPTEWSAIKAVICSGQAFSRLVFFLLCVFTCSAVQSFGFAQRLLSERELSYVLGLSFYPLEQAPNMVIYAMSKLGTATSGLI